MGGEETHILPSLSEERRSAFSAGMYSYTTKDLGANRWFFFRRFKIAPKGSYKQVINSRISGLRRVDHKMLCLDDPKSQTVNLLKF
jgi:hypothetical protein